MNPATTRRFIKAGWQVGAPKDLLGLSHEATVFIEIRICLSRRLRERRTASGMSPSDFALKMALSRSRIEKMAAADSAVPLDILVRALLALGEDAAGIGKALMEWDSGS